MIYYKDRNSGEVYAYDDDVDQSWIKDGLVEMTHAEIEAHLNPPKTDEQIYAEWKAQRQALVDAIEVEYNGVIYQGDEISQSRMVIQIAGMLNDSVTVGWVAKNNNIYQLNKTELFQILQLAVEYKNNIWTLNRPEE